jgi:hypothetical protein
MSQPGVGASVVTQLIRNHRGCLCQTTDRRRPEVIR